MTAAEDDELDSSLPPSSRATGQSVSFQLGASSDSESSATAALPRFRLEAFEVDPQRFQLLQRMLQRAMPESARILQAAGAATTHFAAAASVSSAAAASSTAHAAAAASAKSRDQPGKKRAREEAEEDDGEGAAPDEAKQQVEVEQSAEGQGTQSKRNKKRRERVKRQKQAASTLHVRQSCSTPDLFDWPPAVSPQIIDPRVPYASELGNVDNGSSVCNPSLLFDRGTLLELVLPARMAHALGLILAHTSKRSAYHTMQPDVLVTLVFSRETGSPVLQTTLECSVLKEEYDSFVQLADRGAAPMMQQRPSVALAMWSPARRHPTEGDLAPVSLLPAGAASSSNRDDRTGELEDRAVLGWHGFNKLGLSMDTKLRQLKFREYFEQHG